MPVLSPARDAPPSSLEQRRSRRVRTVAVVSALAAAVLCLFVLATMLGSSLLNPVEVLAGLFGFGEGSANFVVRELRLPRAIAALLVGLALGASGTIFQRVLANPLASPDFLGVASGAGTATVAAIVFFGASGLVLPAAAIGGAVVSAALIWVLAWRRGISGYRFILVGIGVAAFAQSITHYLVARAEFSDARTAMTWLIGSVGMASVQSIVVLAVAAALLVPAGAVIARRLRALELGDETARGLGAAVQRDRMLVLGCAVVLIALATSAAGPLAFVALLAGPLAGILLGAAGPSIAAAALTGAVITQLADLVAQHALPWPLSTGIVTGFVGAPYIAWLIVSANRKGVGA